MTTVSEKARGRRAILARLRRVEMMRNNALARLEMIERERGDLYSEARAQEPPVRWTELAAVSSITPEAVQQKLSRHHDRTGASDGS